MNTNFRRAASNISRPVASEMSHVVAVQYFWTPLYVIESIALVDIRLDLHDSLQGLVDCPLKGLANGGQVRSLLGSRHITYNLLLLYLILLAVTKTR